ncbi:unnamed protein product [Bursaphelenchus okinawaensis]|uniref:Uncharacterized protein n=1 Tax=Bursaphelenchus okinawaensis TaxID=465554 RepID=A0A811LA99_9BILA|nr:unnamed protein product [Bursaphelenchus okinawaensis]CAG9119451.1 unnamed protein product [Bursaphelenchus okinawaensis]
MNIKVKIWTASCPLQAHQVAILGIPFEPSYVSDAMNNPVGDKMTFVDRFWNLVRLYNMYHMFTDIARCQTQTDVRS